MTSALSALNKFYSSSDSALAEESRSLRRVPSGTRLHSNNKLIPVIGLAKREETIITSDLEEIRLPRNSPALKLIMRIRDEAHRFAITYHRKLRSKSAFS